MAIAIIAGDATGAITLSQRVFSGNCPVNQEVIPGQLTIVKSIPAPISIRPRHRQTPIRRALDLGGVRSDNDLPMILPDNRLNPLVYPQALCRLPGKVDFAVNMSLMRVEHASSLSAFP